MERGFRYLTSSGATGTKKLTWKRPQCFEIAEAIFEESNAAKIAIRMTLCQKRQILSFFLPGYFLHSAIKGRFKSVFYASEMLWNLLIFRLHNFLPIKV